MFKLLFYFLSILIFIANSQTISPSPQNEAISESICKNIQLCSDCIQTSGCKWCKDASFNGKRCIYNDTKAGCNSIEDPASSSVSSQIEMSTNKSRNSAITPTKSTVKLRRGQKINITMKYTDEKNRPLDLYILMDLSCTMLTHKETVGKLANQLVKNLGNLTSDLKIGFGSFVDKPVGPFVSSRPLTNQICKGQTLKYTVPHLFKNHLPMTYNVTEFISTVEGATILTNLDIPEGGLDALMQALSCTSTIGWRSEKNTRRLVVMSTDGPFHIAMDGKLGGIVRPNNGQCYMNDDEASIFDYPSISQVRDKMEEESIYVIFAVTKSQVNLYQRLSNEIGHLSAVQSIDGAASIADVIKIEYEKVINKVEFRIPSNKYVDVTYYAKCPGSQVFEKRGGCDNLTPGAEVTFEVEFELKKCPLERDSWKTNVEITPYQSAGEYHSLNITLEMLCGCDCELEDSKNKTEQMKCGDKGHLECGICKCNPGWGGPTCNCSIEIGQFVDQSLCRDNSSRLCGNRGKCVCGECQCKKGYGGKFCECNDNDCFTIENEDKGICNLDLGQGKCGCGRICECTSGFTGVRCQCPVDDKSCKNPDSNDKVCNSYGTCDCGKCTCTEGYGGPFCGHRHAKLKGACDKDLISEIVTCVKCLTVENSQVPETDKFSKCLSPCKEVDPKIVFMDTIDQDAVSECRGSVLDASDCEVLFIIGNRDVITNKVAIRTEKKARAQNCLSPPPILPVILGVIGAVVLIGILLLLIWKVLTYIHDKKEFERFEKEKENATWNLNQNPLYKETVSEFQNPAFNNFVED